MHGTGTERRYILVLVHGSWCTGTAWNEVAMYLRSRGHTVHTPTMAGHGPGADPAASHVDMVQSVIKYLDDHRLSDVVLLGHSVAGSVISQVAQVIPDRIRRLVLHSAFVVEHGHSVMDEVPEQLRDAIRAAARDGAFLPSFALFRDAFIGDATLERAREVYRTLTPEPMRAYEDPLDQRRFFDLVRSGRLPCSFIDTPEECSLPGGWLGMAERLGVYRKVTMPGSHEVMFTAPAGLANRIVDAGRD